MRGAAGALCVVATVVLAVAFVWFSMWQVNAADAMCEQLASDGVIDWKRFAAANPDVTSDAHGLARYIDQGYAGRVFVTGPLLAAVALFSSIYVMLGDRRRHEAEEVLPSRTRG